MSYYKDLEDLLNCIYCKKTKTLAVEILGCYQLKAYRACFVLLWSIIIFDVLCKLQELYDFYGNKQAKALIEKVAKEKEKNKKDNFINSNWEYELILEVNKTFKTNIVTDVAISQIKGLKEYRNLCAHPSLSENLELFQPNNILTKGFIFAIFEELLCKPPLRMDDFIAEFVKDLENNKEILVDNSDKLKNFIFNRYFNNADQPSKDKVFKTLWKFIFVEARAEEDKAIHDVNREINYQALIEIINSDQIHYIKLIESDSVTYSKISNNDDIYDYFLQLLNRFESIADKLNRGELELIRDKIKNDPKLASKGSMLFDSKKEWLKNTFELIEIYICNAPHYTAARNYNYLLKIWFDNAGMEEDASFILYDLFIDKYINASSYNQADLNFIYILEYKDFYPFELIEKLISLIKINNPANFQLGFSQINGRKAAITDYKKFIEFVCNKFTDKKPEIDILMQDFPYISQIRNNEIEEDNDDDEIPF